MPGAAVDSAGLKAAGRILRALHARRLAPVLVATALVIYAPLFFLSLSYADLHPDELLINDVSRLHPTRVHSIVENEEVEGIQASLAMARELGLNVSIAGKRHSMGGHAFYEDALVLDMTSFDDVLQVDAANRTVTVESGATWEDVIEALNPHGLAVGVMQAYNGFTVGGSLSVNVHESDPNYGPLVETVESFRLLLANGTIVNVSRTENADLFSLVIGGYGLFGVILDVTLRVTDDDVLAKSEAVIDYREYPTFFRARTANTTFGQIFARLSISPGDTLLRELLVTTYAPTDVDEPSYHELVPSSVALKKFVFGLSRSFDWGKDLRWYLQKEHSDLVDAPIISRNNLMNGDVAFLDYHSGRNTDILQEYFLPLDELPAFIDDLRAMVEEHDIDLLSATIRYVPENTESVMSYSERESFGLVLYFNIGTSARSQEDVEAWTRDLIDGALDKGGTYYLPYVLYASPEQFRAAYPHSEEFFAAKRAHDPDLLFRNRFYETYAGN